MLKPKNCYFHAYFDDNISCTIVTIVPIKYWNSNNCMSDEELDIADLPEYLDQEMESTFVTTEDVSKVIYDLLSLGFKENEEFSRFMNADLQDE
jgi:hypothetical protein